MYDKVPLYFKIQKALKLGHVQISQSKEEKKQAARQGRIISLKSKMLIGFLF